MNDTSPQRLPLMQRPALWGAAYFAALAAMVADANLGLLADPWRWLLKALVLVLIVPLLLSARRQAELDGPESPAFRTFNFRLIAAVGACIVVFAVGASIYRSFPPGSPALWLLALVTAVPLLAMIWAMARYLSEETDEYLRHLAIMSALTGLAAVLVIATVWGFLENLGLVPHVWSWWLVPVFAVAYGLARGWLKARGR